MVPGPGATVTIMERGAVERVDLANSRVLSAASVPQGALVIASTNGQLAAASSPDGTITFVDLRNSAVRHPIPKLDAPLVAMALSADGSMLAGVAPREGVIRVWDTSNGVERATFTSTFGPVRTLAWSPDGTRLYTTPTGVAGLQAWDLSSYVSPATQLTAGGPAGSGLTTTTAVEPTTRTLAVGTDLGRPWFLDLDSGRAHSSTGSKRAPVVSVAFAGDGRLALTADAVGVLTLWDPATGDVIADLSQPTRADTQSDVARAPVAPDGRTAASFIDGYGLQLVGVVSRRIGPPVFPDLGNQSTFEVLGWSPDGRFVVVGAQGIMVSPTIGFTPGVWALVDPRDGRVVWRRPAPEQVVAADAVFAENGGTIVLPGESGRLYFVDAATGALQDPAGAAAARPPAVNDRQTPASVSVSPDGSHLSVVSQAHPVEIWDVATAEQSGTVQVPASTINSHFLSDHELVTTTVTGAVSIHDLSVADWIRLACKAARRELTPIEWDQFLPTHPYQRVCSTQGGQGVSS
jgi:WD40 repeat protein